MTMTCVARLHEYPKLTTHYREGKKKRERDKIIYYFTSNQEIIVMSFKTLLVIKNV